MADIRQSPQWAEYMRDLGWEVEKVDNCQIYIKKLPLGLGSLIKILRPSLPIPFEKIDKIAKGHRAWFVKLEPEVTGRRSEVIGQRLRERGFSPSSWPLSPSKTIRIDLKKSEKELWADLKKETRNTVRKAIKNGALINQSGEIEQFCDLWVKSMHKKGNLFANSGEITEIWRAFEKNSHLLLAYHPAVKDQPLAGALIITRDRVASYIFAASTKEGNKFGAPSLVVWEAIRMAKKLGCGIFDLEGIYDRRYHQATKNWKGFSRFKKRFGGEEIAYIGSFVKYYNLLFKSIPLLASSC